MAVVLEETSTITAKGQTTIPKAVRKALGVDCGGRIAFRVDGQGVSVYRVGAEANDPVVDSFLDFLARDIGRRPEAIEALSPALATRIADLTKAMDVDPGEEIEGEVAL